eukprot:TRINITY_DN17449_c0_g1_i2.p1 TRINITY_DN17449_c0_g1~~TRINITY_DN17449_c0_g1_i2.p1  ORF type:complete len:899 (-),score=116.24 TRINITY_DN17449_c0_g1_i2:119-2815(-)
MFVEDNRRSSNFTDEDSRSFRGTATVTDSDTEEFIGPCGCWSSSVTPMWGGIALLVVFFWGTTSIAGSAQVVRLFTEKSSVNYAPLPDSPSQVGGARLWSNFPFLAGAASSEVVMVIRSLDGRTSLLNDQVKAFSEKVAARAKTDERTAMFDPVVIGYYIGNDDISLGAQDFILESGFVSADESLMVILFLAKNLAPEGSDLTGAQVMNLGLSLLYELSEDPPSGTEVILTGSPVTSQDAALDQSIHFLLIAEIAVLPIAFLVLVCLVRHVRLLILPLFTLANTFLTAVAICTPVIDIFGSFSSDIPAGMLSVTIALSLDYNLFILTRFKDNMGSNMSLFQNVKTVLHTSSHTVILSGLLIAIAFAGATIIPETNLQEAGVFMALTTLTCMAVNATLLPALLLLFGRVLTIPICRSERDPAKQPLREERDLALARSRESPRSARRPGGSCDFWLSLMRCVERCPLMCVVFLLLFFLPLILFVPQTRATADAYEMLPEDLPSIRAARLMHEKGLPQGRFDPFTIVIDWRHHPDISSWNTLTYKPGQKSSMLCQFAFEAVYELCALAVEMDGVSSALGPTWLMNEPVDWQYAHTLTSPTINAHWQKLQPIYAAVLQTHVTEQFLVTQIHTNFAPRSDTAARWVVEMRQLLAAWEKRHPQLQATLTGGACEGVDTRDAVMDSMPTYIGFTAVLLMVCIMVMFRSLMLTLRLAFALIFTLAVCFGFAVFVYQTGYLIPIFPNLANTNGLAFESVPIPACLAIALGLDYDIFLITRIVELRTSGYSDRDSIVFGVASTGDVISGAGLIMALAFAGFAFSPKVMHQQFALLLITSVLLDTFVVRTILVPAMMLFAKDWNWWPRKMPPPRRSGYSDNESAVGSGFDTGLETGTDGNTVSGSGESD